MNQQKTKLLNLVYDCEYDLDDFIDMLSNPEVERLILMFQEFKDDKNDDE